MKFFYRLVAASLVMWAAKEITQAFQQKGQVRTSNAKVDQMLEDSFPSSDPSSSWAGATPE